MTTGPFPPRVWLNPVAAWKLPDRLDISPGLLSLLMNGKRSPTPEDYQSEDAAAPQGPGRRARVDMTV